MSESVKNRKPIANQEKNGITSFFKGLKNEVKRITWAPKNDVKKATIITLFFCIMYMIAVGIIDFGFSRLSQFIYK